jgi:hypothetical protein
MADSPSLVASRGDETTRSIATLTVSARPPEQDGASNRLRAEPAI